MLKVWGNVINKFSVMLAKKYEEHSHKIDTMIITQKLDGMRCIFLKENNIVVDKELESKVNELIEKRNNLKKEKKYEEADKVRDEIKALGAEIKDTREGVVIIWE